MGQCNQICQVSFQSIEVNQFKMIDPQILDNICYFRKENKQKLKQLSKNSKSIHSYQEIVTSEYIFFGFLIQVPSNQQLKYQDKIININGKLPHGQGILIKRTISYYKGNFKMGIIEGKGIQKTQQWTFQGQYQNGNRKNGKFKNNIFQYQGTFQNNQISGKGKLKFQDGNVYGGQIFNGKMHGRGKLIYLNGDQYQGEFKENQYHGEGTYVWKDGTIYKGKYKNGKKHGFGVLHSNGQKHACCWINNQPVAKPLTYKQFQAKKQIQITKSKKQIKQQKNKRNQNSKIRMKTELLLPVPL